MRIFLAAICALGAWPLARAQLEVVPNHLDFGPTPQHQLEKAELTVTNRGTTPANILEVKGSCSCTSGSVDASVLAPGAATRLHVRFYTQDFEGVIDRRVSLKTSAGNLTVPLRASVYQYEHWLFTPSRVNFGPPSPEGQIGEISLRYVGPAGHATYHPAATVEGTTAVRIDRTEPEPGLTRFVFRVTPGSTSGIVRGALVIATGDPTSPRLEIPIVSHLNLPAG